MASPTDQDPRVANTLAANRWDAAANDYDAESSTPASRGSIDAAQIGRFRILHEIGAGGMGVVYAAYDETLDRKVAIKLLHIRGSVPAGERLQQEAQVMARISHPNVVQIYDVGEYRGQLYVAMEFLDGVPLTRWIAEASPGWSDTIAMFVQAGRGLQAAHDAGVIHRDFKPDNVVITRGRRGDLRVKVVDFGIATIAAEDTLTGGGDPVALDDHASAASLTATGSLMGTLGYMSPEHFRGQVRDPRSDQFSFAIALYEALYGERPFPGEGFRELSAAVLAGAVRPAPTSDVPSWAHDTLLRALAHEPERRYASMDELITTLAEHPARTADPQHDQSVALRQRVWMFAVLTTGAVGLLAALVYLWFYASADVLADYTFWSKIFFAGVTILTVLANKHVFLRNTYNRWVGTMVVSMCGGTIACAIAAHAAALAPAEADRFVLIVVIITFGQASTNLNRWYVGIAWLGVVALLASLVIPFIASLALGVCVIVGFGMTVYLWKRRSRAVPRSAGARASANASANASASANITDLERSGVLEVPTGVVELPRQRRPRGPVSRPRSDRP